MRRGTSADRTPRESVEEEWDLPGLGAALEREFSLQVDPKAWMDANADLTNEDLRERLLEVAGARAS